MLAVSTLLFTSLNARIALSLCWVERIQIMPLALAGALTALGVWLLVTLIFGRIYCSTVCPLGVLQDFFAHIPRSRLRRRNRLPYHHSNANNKLRYFVLATVAAFGFCGFTFLPTLLDPFASFVRICHEFLRPALDFIGGKEVIFGSLLAFMIAAVTIVAVAFFSWFNGRIICNTICPVGSLLSIPARWSLLHFDIDTDLCVNCRACEHACKSQCISMTNHLVDSSRCVVCFNCMDVCKEGAIRYTIRNKRLSLPMLQRIQPKVGAATTSSSTASSSASASRLLDRTNQTSINSNETISRPA